jgi:thiol-disulfide isomerase/thioredoxin
MTAHARRIVAAILLATCAVARAASVGEAAPPLRAQDSSGHWLHLQELRGKVVYVDFWASWCAPCRKSMPMLDRLQQQWAEDLVVIGVNVDAKHDDALGFLKNTPVDFPIVFDPRGEWAEKFAAPGMPTGYLIDRAGVIRHVKVGYKASELSELETTIKSVVEGGS